MSLLPFQKTQYNLTGHLRNPTVVPAPANTEHRRVAIYCELIYNNIEGFIANGFPILREILDDAHWHSMVREFVSEHKSASPYFLEISQEFLAYLQNERNAPNDPPFLLELAHYEWVELALDVALEELPPRMELGGDILSSPLQVSPLLWSLSYSFPVHQIGPDFQPQEPTGEPTFLLVYRNRQDLVEFMHSNAVTVRLLKILQSDTLTGRQALAMLAEEMQHPDAVALEAMGATLLQDLVDKDMLW